MRVIRIFVPFPLQTNAEITLPEAASRHVARVLRMRSGDWITLFDGTGGEFEARIVAATPKQVVVITAERAKIDRESPLPITLVQGVSKGARMDIVVQKATELGVTNIQPVLTDRSVLKLDADKALSRQAHWQSVALSACEQCGRNRLPDVRAPLAYSVWLASFGLASAEPSGSAFVLTPGASESLSAKARDASNNESNENAPHPLMLLIGPEGGLTDSEIKAALVAGFFDVSLGPRVLRTETAALAAISVLQTVRGDFC